VPVDSKKILVNTVEPGPGHTWFFEKRLGTKESPDNITRIAVLTSIINPTIIVLFRNPSTDGLAHTGT